MNNNPNSLGINRALPSYPSAMPLKSKAAGTSEDHRTQHIQSALDHNIMVIDRQMNTLQTHLSQIHQHIKQQHIQQQQQNAQNQWHHPYHSPLDVIGYI